MALHAARPSVKDPSRDTSRLVMRLLTAAGAVVLVVIAFFAMLRADGCAFNQEEMVTGYSYWAYPHTAHGRVLSYNSSTYTAVVSLCPDSDVLMEYPDEPGFEWVLYCNRHFNGENVVTLYCEDEADGKYELPVGPLEQGAYVDLSLWLSKDEQGRLKCERIDVVDSFDYGLAYASAYVDRFVATSDVSEDGDCRWRSASRVPNKDFKRNII